MKNFVRGGKEIQNPEIEFKNVYSHPLQIHKTDEGSMIYLLDQYSMLFAFNLPEEEEEEEKEPILAQFAWINQKLSDINLSNYKKNWLTQSETRAVQQAGWAQANSDRKPKAVVPEKKRERMIKYHKGIQNYINYWIETCNKRATNISQRLTLAKPYNWATMARGIAGNRTESLVPRITSWRLANSFLTNPKGTLLTRERSDFFRREEDDILWAVLPCLISLLKPLRLPFSICHGSWDAI